MKSMFICVDSKVNEHVGEEYDYILEVEDSPTTENIQEIADRVRGRIRALWNEQESEDKEVSVNLHGPSPYNAMLINLKIIMKQDEDIEVSLVYPHEELRTTEDPETVEVLGKLEDRQGVE